MTQEEKTLWMAEVKALKANCYFELFRRYGPIVLVPQNLEANSAIEDMQQPRQPVDSCVNAIVRLCDEAIPDLPYMSRKESARYCYYNKEAAATLKAYALLYADIAADGTYWVQAVSRSSDTTYEAFEVNTKCRGNLGSQQNVISANYTQNLSGYWVKKGIDPTVGMYMYTDQASGQNYQILFRMAEVYLMAAEAWNEYLDQPGQHVYDMINAVRGRAGIPDVQTAWHNYAQHPDKVDTKDGMREIIQREWNIEFAFEGRRFWNLRRWMTAPQELNQPQYGWDILGETNQTFYNNYEGPVVVWSKRQFTAPRDYFWPIRAEEMNGQKVWKILTMP